MATAAYFRQKTEQCRRLAETILTSNASTAAALLALATEFETKAAGIEAEASAAAMIGYGGDIGDQAPPTAPANGNDEEPPSRG